MPQMAPMNWTLLFTMFILLYLVSMTLIYFNISQSNQSYEQVNQFSKISMPWMW